MSLRSFLISAATSALMGLAACGSVSHSPNDAGKSDSVASGGATGAGGAGGFNGTGGATATGDGGSSGIGGAGSGGTTGASGGALGSTGGISGTGGAASVGGAGGKPGTGGTAAGGSAGGAGGRPAGTIVLLGSLEALGTPASGTIRISRAGLTFPRSRICNTSVCLSGGISP